MDGSKRLSPREWHERAIASERAGAPDEAERIIAEALGAFPREHELHNSAANIALRRGDLALAAQRFADALSIAPSHMPYAINQAIALVQAGKYKDAIAVLALHEAAGANDPRYCSTRANAARLARDLAQASTWYDRALALDGKSPRALVGRARVALERNEADVLARIDFALASEPGDAHLWLAKAQALDLLGDRSAALALTRQIVEAAPAWHDGLEFMTQLRRAADEKDFADHYAAAAKMAPQASAVPAAHVTALAKAERFEQAAEVARAAQAQFPDDERFVLYEAAFSSAAGDDERARLAFARLREDSIDRALHEARHALRTQAWDGAQAALDRALKHSPFDVTAWALTGLLWRVTNDPRVDWLHGQEGLARLMPLADADAVVAPALALLQRVHADASFPHDQSLRGGTQTRGGLFDRAEPEIAALRSAIEASVEGYRQSLPPGDERHPLLRFRDAPWTIAGSWSVRLTGGGDHHASHIHPEGVLSSALYLALPQVADDASEAVLELGRPPPDLRLDLAPLDIFTPKAGHLALFPSTLYHGTTGFAAGERLTVAFDVVAV